MSRFMTPGDGQKCKVVHTGSCLLTSQSSRVGCQLSSSVGSTQKPELLASGKVQLSSPERQGNANGPTRFESTKK